MANVFAKSFLAVVASCVAATAASAQGPDELFKEAVQLLRLNKKPEALAKFREVLKADPTNEQAWSLYTKTDKDIWEELLLQKGEIEKIAQHLLLKARAGRIQMNRDAALIKDLVSKACGDDYETYFKAMEELRAKHGEFAVPALVDRLANADDDKGVRQATIALERIGRAATLPLIQALNSDKAVTRQNVCVALGRIADTRARAALARLVNNDEDAVVRDLASAALKKLNVPEGTTAASLYRAAATSYLTGTASVGMNPGEVIWRMTDGKLVASDIAPSLYWMELAKQNAEAALAIDPAHPDSQSLVARSYLAQVAAIRSGAAAGDDAAKSQLGTAKNLRMVAMAMGPKILRKAFTDSAAQPLVQVAAAEALSEAENMDTIESSPLNMGLDSNIKDVRYASALALVKASKGDDVPNVGKVVAILGDAVTEESVRRIYMIGGGKAAMDAAASLGRGSWTDGNFKGSGKEALDKLLGYQDADVLVINEQLSDVVPETVIGILRKRARFKGTKIVIVSTNTEKAEERFGEKVDGYIAGPLTADNLKAAVDAAMKDVPADPIRARAENVAERASAHLSKLAAARVEITDALTNLSKQLNRSDIISIAAANAIGDGGSEAEAGALSTAIQGSGSTDVRVACANALGKILARSKGDVDAALFTALSGLAAKADVDIKVRGAVVTALGKARLNPSQRLMLGKALSTAVMSASSDDGE